MSCTQKYIYRSIYTELCTQNYVHIKMFTVIVITMPTPIVDEGKQIAKILSREDVGIVHIRKPGYSLEEMENLILSIDKKYYSRIVLHDHFQLAVKYNLYGVHINSRNPFPPDNWKGSISRSCHCISEVKECKGNYNYVSLSPVFNSISKKGYCAAFSEDEIVAARAKGIIDEKVFALGGIRFALLDKIKSMGFGGAMILGDAWGISQ